MQLCVHYVSVCLSLPLFLSVTLFVGFCLSLSLSFFFYPVCSFWSVLDYYRVVTGPKGLFIYLTALCVAPLIWDLFFCLILASLYFGWLFRALLSDSQQLLVINLFAFLCVYVFCFWSKLPTLLNVNLQGESLTTENRTHSGHQLRPLRWIL